MDHARCETTRSAHDVGTRETVTIQYVELDDGKVPHVNRHGVTLTEVDRCC
jgi:hypothetical protein